MRGALRAIRKGCGGESPVIRSHQRPGRRHFLRAMAVHSLHAGRDQTVPAGPRLLWSVYCGRRICAT